jgi:pimeloyl-ACP methyl ester carboxylesterase
MAETAEEAQTRRRRRRLLQGLVIGGAALGLPALLNALVARRARGLAPVGWGRPRELRWREGAVVFQELGVAGPPVLLVHSLGPGHSSLEWRPLAAALGERYRLIVPDLLGWGESEHPGLVYDGQLYIDLIGDLLGDLLAEPATIVATGLAAAYAIQVAADSPELVAALGLIAPLGLDHHSDEPDLKDAVVHRLLRLPILGTSALNLFTSRSGLTHHLERELGRSIAGGDGALLDAHYRLSHLPGAKASLAAYLSGYLNHSVAGALERVRCPVWLGWGRESHSPPVSSADLWLHQLPAAELEVFEGTAAMPHLERPREVAASLDDFLTRRLGG